MRPNREMTRREYDEFLILRKLILRKLPTLVREKAKSIFEVFKNPNTPRTSVRWFLTFGDLYSSEDAKITRFENILNAVKRMSLRSNALLTPKRAYEMLTGERIKVQSDELAKVINHIYLGRIFREWEKE